MFKKFKNGTTTISKDLNESIKTLSYLARAEKYFDLELTKNGHNTKPLLRIVDVIESLRRIHDITAQLEKKLPVPESAKTCFDDVAEILDVSNDILALNPKGLVTSDKAVLAKLGPRLEEARRLAGFPPSSYINTNTAPASEVLMPKTAAAPAAPKINPNPSIAEQLFKRPEPVKSDEILQPSNVLLPAPESEVVEAAPRKTYELDQPLEWENPVAAEKSEAAPTKAEKTAEAPKKKKVVSIKQPKKQTVSLPQKYFATSYAGMNLQEAAEIINELASSPSNLEIILLEHSSRVKPVAQAKEIANELSAIAPIADSFETSGEIIDKKHLAVLKDADRIITACKDLANLQIDGFDRRKQKLFEKFVPQDIKRTVELAKIAYPEVFSTTDANGDNVTNNLLDFADIIIEFGPETEDKLFAELISQVVSQIALYAENNDLRMKFDINVKKNRLNGASAQPLATRSQLAVLRAITFVPKIARHAQEILMSDNISEKQSDIVNRSLEILQLAYIHARDNYSAEIQNFYSNKAA